MLRGWCSGDLNSGGEITMNESNVTARLFEVIKQMSEDEQLALLKELERRLLKWTRERKREPFFMVVNYSVEDRFYTSHILDISAGGVFIETRIPFTAGQEVSLTFPLPDYQKHIKIIGKIVRVTQQGIGVKFKTVNQDQEAMIKPLLGRLSRTRS
jgi:Tfp pilus assembly protein PilZ